MLFVVALLPMFDTDISLIHGASVSFLNFGGVKFTKVVDHAS